MNELPNINNNAYSNSTYDAESIGVASGSSTGLAWGSGRPYQRASSDNAQDLDDDNSSEYLKRLDALVRQQHKPKENVVANETKAQKRRVARVYIIDPDHRVPLDKCVIHTGDEKLTDLTDQELFFEIDLKDLLASHNKHRVTVLDEVATQKAGRDVFLKEARIRELLMQVVTIAEFTVVGQ